MYWGQKAPRTGEWRGKRVAYSIALRHDDASVNYVSLLYQMVLRILAKRTHRPTQSPLPALWRHLRLVGPRSMWLPRSRAAWARGARSLEIM
jgi:hypothetical protein